MFILYFMRHCRFFGVFSWVTIGAFSMATIQPSYALDYKLERLESVKFFNVEKEISKLLKPIKDLNKNSSMDEIAKAAGNFKRKLDKIYPTGLSVNQAFDLVIQELAGQGVKIKKKKLKPLIKKAGASLIVSGGVEVVKALASENERKKAFRLGSFAHFPGKDTL